VNVRNHVPPSTLPGKHDGHSETKVRVKEEEIRSYGHIGSKECDRVGYLYSFHGATEQEVKYHYVG
jgi:hypothetical protein